MKHDPLNRSMSIDRPLFGEDLAPESHRVTAPIGDPESLVIGNEGRGKNWSVGSTRFCLNSRQRF